MTKNGIDVSKWQGNIDWSRVKSSGKVDYAILRAGYGSSTVDTKFNTYYANAKAQGIPLGAYWFCYATTVAEAKQEAQKCLATIKGKTFEYPIYYDIEDSATLKTGKNNVSAIAKAFCEELEKAGYYVGIYSMRSGLQHYLTDDLRKKYTVWVAEIRSGGTLYKDPHDMWQYSWKGKIAGINGDVDQDYCYKDFPTIIKESGLNGFAKPAETKPVTQTSIPTEPVVSAPVQNTQKKLYNVKIVCSALNVRSGPGTNYPAKQVVHKNEIYSIVEEKNGWLKLISGAGWISGSSKYVKKL